MQSLNGHPSSPISDATWPGVDEAYDEEAEQWDAKHVGSREMAENRYVFNEVRKGGHLDGDVLEIASGTGLLLEWCRVDPLRYTGVDVSRRMCVRAGKKFPKHRFEVADMCDLPFEDNSFDNVVQVFAGLSYAARPSDAIQEFARVLRPGGQLMVMPYAMTEIKLGEYVVHDHRGHPVERTGYTPRELFDLLSQEFFDVRVVGFTGPLTRNVASRLGQVAADALVEAEARALRWKPSGCSFLIGTGRLRSW